jgi:hypothetical protein
VLHRTPARHPSCEVPTSPNQDRSRHRNSGPGGPQHSNRGSAQWDRRKEQGTYHLTPGSTMAELLTILLLAAAASTMEAQSGQWKLALVRGACRRQMVTGT